MKTAMKHINAIFAGVMVISLFLPFITVSFMGISKSANYFDAFDGGRTIFLILLLVGIVALAAANYVKQVAAYAKYINIAAPAVTLISAFLSVSNATGSMMGAKSSFGFGVWLIAIVSVLAIAVAVIKLLGLKGNPVFDAVNDDAE